MINPPAEQEQCSYCNQWYPKPVSLHHSEAECSDNVDKPAHQNRHADCQDECQTAAARGPAYRCDHRQCDVLACEEYDAKRAGQTKEGT